MEDQAMDQSVQVIGIVVSVLLALFTLLLGIIGYFVVSKMRSIDGSLKCLPDIQVELAGMKVKVDQQSERQEAFTDHQEAFGKRLGEVERYISNQERIAVLEKSVETLDAELGKLRPHVHSQDGFIQTLVNKVAVLEAKA
jgi:hypothetical protein